MPLTDEQISEQYLDRQQLRNEAFYFLSGYDILPSLRQIRAAWRLDSGDKTIHALEFYLFNLRSQIKQERQYLAEGMKMFPNDQWRKRIHRITIDRLTDTIIICRETLAIAKHNQEKRILWRQQQLENADRLLAAWPALENCELHIGTIDNLTSMHYEDTSQALNQLIADGFVTWRKSELFGRYYYITQDGLDFKKLL